MHKVSRTSLAHFVCPSAPFLAPRLLRTTIPVAVTSLHGPPSAGLQRPTYATKSRGKGLYRKIDPKTAKQRATVPRVSDEDAETARLLSQFRNACEIRHVHQMMELYPSLLAANILNSYDTRRITQALHVRIRNARQEQARSDLFPFVQQVVTDIRSGALEPHNYAFVHLFGICKDCKRFDEGHALWQWLVQQDERHVSQAAYGAAIELMAYGGIMRLPDLEKLYVDGLKRFPGTFAEYHLAPDAIVPDRTQLTTVKGIPTILLQGILSARILNRDWKKAYLALDTALRLYPTQTPSRYFELFMTERPISEAYTAFMVASRSGVTMRPTHVTALITKMRAAMGASQSMADRLLLVRAIANAIYAYLEAGGQLESIHVGSLIHTFEQLLPEPIAGEDYVGEAAEMRNIIVVAAHEILSGLIQAGMSPQVHPFEALISVSGKLRVPSLLSTTLDDVKTAGTELGPIGTRSAITSAGLLKNKELIEQFWSQVVSAAEANSAQISFEDWITFTKACRRADHADYFRSQLLKLPHAINSRTESHLVYQIDMPEPAPTGHDSYQYMSLDELTSDLDALTAQMKNIEAVVMSGQPLDLSATPFYMHLDPSHPSLGTDKDLRTVYNELTTDPHQPPPDSIPVSSPTGIPLDDLRFMNWVSVLEMMDLASSYESKLQIALDAAIKAGKPFKGTPELLRLRKDGGEGERRTAPGLRLQIQHLRTTNPDDVNVFRRVGSDDPGKRLAIRKHVVKDEGERVVSGGAQKIRLYVGLESDQNAPGVVRKVGFSDGKIGKEEVEGSRVEDSQATPKKSST